jgi:ketosteroid isomerase-like protein
MVEHLDTAEVICRFNDAFLGHDPAALPPLVAEACVIENTTPAPNGSRHAGRAACLDVWQPLAANRKTAFDVEGVEVYGERAVIFWRFRWGEDEEQSVRGVNLMLVRDGQIVEARGYVKGA